MRKSKMSECSNHTAAIANHNFKLSNNGIYFTKLKQLKSLPRFVICVVILAISYRAKKTVKMNNRFVSKNKKKPVS